MIEGDALSNTASYLLCIKEEITAPQSATISFVILDTSIAEFAVGELEKDDKFRSQLETLLLQIQPKEILYERVCYTGYVIFLSVIFLTIETNRILTHFPFDIY